MGLIALGWRAGAVQLMGRWESEAVKLYTREAALRAPIDLGVLMELLTGMARSELPSPPEASPEPSLPHMHEWILNPANDMYHLASRTSERTRCGWDYRRFGGVRGPQPPPWYWTTCGGCAPERRKKLKAEAEEIALLARADSGAP